MLTSSAELDERIATGVIGGVSLLLLVIFGGWIGIFFLIMLLSLGMVYEFTEMTFAMPDKVEKRYVLLSLTWFIGILNLLLPQAEAELLVATFVILFIYYLVSARRHEDLEFNNHFKELMYSLFCLFYLVFLPLYFLKIYETPNGIHWTILFLIIVWAGDTGAYFTGKKYGDRKLYPRISPKKTIEGSAGGLASGFVGALLYKLIFFRTMPWLAVLFVPVTVGVFAQVGDLCESFLKRAFNTKDSGSILPGHGGFLDRFDSVVFSLPVMYACLRVFG